ncbi:MAG TPA: LysE family transporter [Actinophytocola sp.]|jgi:threonine/homoserine/homoserine lactone efflux protein|uniref:LysE family translocator n=1 Tax=Actinophytocola sp. TaxID=1872138 RepID=UPI002E07998D|nr:LysE family transporter [Actinophytocola sp.]
MTWSGLLAFLPASLLLAMVPGVGTAMLIKQSVRGGRRGALATVAGMEAGVAVWATTAALGLSVLLLASEVAYEALRIVGVLVLLGSVRGHCSAGTGWSRPRRPVARGFGPGCW